MQTKSWVKFSILILLVWNLVITYRYYKEHIALNIAERTLYKHFEPEYMGDEKPEWKVRRDAKFDHFN